MPALFGGLMPFDSEDSRSHLKKLRDLRAELSPTAKKRKKPKLDIVFSEKNQRRRSANKEKVKVNKHALQRRVDEQANALGLLEREINKNDKQIDAYITQGKELNSSIQALRAQQVKLKQDAEKERIKDPSYELEQITQTFKAKSPNFDIDKPEEIIIKVDKLKAQEQSYRKELDSFREVSIRLLKLVAKPENNLTDGERKNLTNLIEKFAKEGISFDTDFNAILTEKMKEIRDAVQCFQPIEELYGKSVDNITRSHKVKKELIEKEKILRAQWVKLGTLEKSQKKIIRSHAVLKELPKETREDFLKQLEEIERHDKEMIILLPKIVEKHIKLTEQLEQYNTTLKGLMERLDELQLEETEVELSDDSRKKDKLDKIKTEITELQERIDNLEGRINKHEGELARLDPNAEARTDKIKVLFSMITKAKDQEKDPSKRASFNEFIQFLDGSFSNREEIYDTAYQYEAKKQNLVKVNKIIEQEKSPSEDQQRITKMAMDAEEIRGALGKFVNDIYKLNAVRRNIQQLQKIPALKEQIAKAPKVKAESPKVKELKDISAQLAINEERAKEIQAQRHKLEKLKAENNGKKIILKSQLETHQKELSDVENELKRYGEQENRRNELSDLQHKKDWDNSDYSSAEDIIATELQMEEEHFNAQLTTELNELLSQDFQRKVEGKAEELAAKKSAKNPTKPSFKEIFDKNHTLSTWVETISNKLKRLSKRTDISAIDKAKLAFVLVDQSNRKTKGLKIKDKEALNALKEISKEYRNKLMQLFEIPKEYIEKNKEDYDAFSKRAWHILEEPISSPATPTAAKQSVSSEPLPQASKPMSKPQSLEQILDRTIDKESLGEEPNEDDILIINEINKFVQRLSTTKNMDRSEKAQMFYVFLDQVQRSLDAFQKIGALNQLCNRYKKILISELPDHQKKDLANTTSKFYQSKLIQVKEFLKSRPLLDKKGTVARMRAAEVDIPLDQVERGVQVAIEKAQSDLLTREQSEPSSDYQRRRDSAKDKIKELQKSKAPGKYKAKHLLWRLQSGGKEKIRKDREGEIRKKYSSEPVEPEKIEPNTVSKRPKKKS